MQAPESVCPAEHTDLSHPQALTPFKSHIHYGPNSPFQEMCCLSRESGRARSCCRHVGSLVWYKIAAWCWWQKKKKKGFAWHPSASPPLSHLGKAVWTTHYNHTAVLFRLCSGVTQPPFSNQSQARLRKKGERQGWEEMMKSSRLETKSLGVRG